MYQRYSSMFLGLTPDQYMKNKDTITERYDEKGNLLFCNESTNISNGQTETEGKIAMICYYHLNKNDMDFNRKFHSNLALCIANKDQSYKDWLIMLAKEIQPDLNETNLSIINFKPRPHIVRKDNTMGQKNRPRITKKISNTLSTKPDKSNKKKQNNVFERPTEIHVIPSDALWNFMYEIGACVVNLTENNACDINNMEENIKRNNAMKDTGKNTIENSTNENKERNTIPIAHIKESINKYIYDKKLQDMTKRCNVHLDNALQILFDELRRGQIDITYLELRDYIKSLYSHTIRSL